MVDKINIFTSNGMPSLDYINKFMYGNSSTSKSTSTTGIGQDTDTDDEGVLTDKSTDTSTTNTTTNTSTGNTTSTDNPKGFPNDIYDDEQEQEIREKLNEYIDDYLETACDGLDFSGASAMETYVRSMTETFLEQYLAKQQEITIALTNLRAEYNAYMDDSVASWKTNNEAAMAAMEYAKGTDSSELYSNLMNSAEIALAGNNRFSDKEMTELKDQTVDYILSTMMDGNVDKAMLNGINTKYSVNSNYQKAVVAINKLKSETDPQKQLEYYNEAKENITQFLSYEANAANLKTVLANGVEANKAAKVEAEKAELKEDILPMVDIYIENYIKQNPDLSEEEIAQIQQFLNDSLDEFLTDEVSGEDKSGRLKTRLTTFLDGKIEQQNAVKAMMDNIKEDPMGLYDDMNALAKSVMSDKFVSNTEAEKLKDITSDFLINQLLLGADASDLLKNINSRYTTNTDYKNAVSLIKQLQSATNPEEIQELYNEAKAALTNFLGSVSGSDLANAIKNSGPIEVSDEQKNRIIGNSSIGADYTVNVTRTTGKTKTKNKESILEDVQAMALQDMAAIAESLKAELKSSMGTNYDEEKVSDWIADAMTDTLAIFTENAMGKENHASGGNYDLSSDEMSFVWGYRSSIKKHKNEDGRWTYNVQALANTFIDKFNEVSKNASLNSTDPSSKTYDIENVIGASVGNDYYTNKKYEDDDKTALINRAKATLTSVGTALRSNLTSQGISVDDIDNIIDDSITETVNEWQDNNPSSRYTGNNSLIKKLLAQMNQNSYNTADLINVFLAKVEEKAGLKKQTPEE